MTSAFVDCSIGGGVVQEVAYCGACQYGDPIANATLIAAAPVMLATLKSMRETLLRMGGDPMPTLDAVIAQAEGR